MATEDSRDSTANTTWIALCFVGIGFALRCRGYFDAWPNPDEGAYYAIAMTTSWSSFQAEIAHHTHPPGIYALHRLLAQVPEIGGNLAWLRLPSLLGGSAAIYGVYLAGRELRSDRVGLIAAGLLALSPASIVLAQVLRPYGVLAAALAFGSAWLLRYARQRDARSLALAACAISVALLVQYSTLLALPAAALLLLRSALAEQQRGASPAPPIATLALWTAIAAALLTLYVVPNLLGEPIHQGAQASWLASSFHSNPLEAVGALPELFALGAGSALAWAALLGAAAGFVELARTRNVDALLLTAGTFFVALNASWLGLYPFGSSRHGFYLVVLLTPVVALGLDGGLRRGRTGVAAVAATLVMSLGIHFSSPSRVDLEERLATNGEIEAQLATLDTARGERGLWLLDRQTYRMLSPYFGLAGEPRERDPQHPGVFTWFDWGKARVVVAPPWRIRPGTKDISQANHIFGAWVRASRVSELEAARFQQGLWIVGGWNLRSPEASASTALLIRPINWANYIARMQPRKPATPPEKLER